MYNHACCSHMHICTQARLICLHILACFHSHAPIFFSMCTIMHTFVHTHNTGLVDALGGLASWPEPRQREVSLPAPAHRSQLRSARPTPGIQEQHRGGSPRAGCTDFPEWGFHPFPGARSWAALQDCPRTAQTLPAGAQASPVEQPCLRSCG